MQTTPDGQRDVLFDQIDQLPFSGNRSSPCHPAKDLSLPGTPSGHTLPSNRGNRHAPGTMIGHRLSVSSEVARAGGTSLSFRAGSGAAVGTGGPCWRGLCDGRGRSLGAGCCGAAAAAGKSR
jgi:hypothetical protein